MRRLAIAVGLAVVLAATANPAASAQQLADPPAAEQNCVIAPTTTTSPVPTTTTAVPIPACTSTDTTASTPPVQIATTEAPAPSASTMPTTTTTTTTTDLATSTPTETYSVVPTFELPTPGPAVSPTTDTTTTTVPTVPIETATSSARSPAPAARAAAAPAASSLLDLQVPGELVAQTGVLTPGIPWTGSMKLDVVSALGNWTTTVSLSPFRGRDTGTTVTPVASYSAPESNCTLSSRKSPGVIISTLSATPVNAKTGGGIACLTSWTATVNILVPDTNLLADTYTATLTHSIY